MASGFSFVGVSLYSMESWIKLHRRFLDWGWYSDANTMRVFVHLLIKANYEQSTWMGIEILPGQVITGRIKLSYDLQLSEQQIRTSLRNLQSTNEITIKSTNKYSIVTICKWEEYQGEYNTKQPTKQPTKTLKTNQPSTTLKEDIDTNVSLSWRESFGTYLKECRSEYSKYYHDEEQMKLQSRLNPGINVPLTIDKSYANYWGTEEGWKNKKKTRIKIINWKQTITNAISNPANRVYLTKEELAECK